jgi:hypothetical protein
VGGKLEGGVLQRLGELGDRAGQLERVEDRHPPRPDGPVPPV